MTGLLSGKRNLKRRTIGLMIGRISVRKKDMDTDGEERWIGVKIVLSLRLQAVVTANVVNLKVNF